MKRILLLILVAFSLGLNAQVTLSSSENYSSVLNPKTNKFETIRHDKEVTYFEITDSSVSMIEKESSDMFLVTSKENIDGDFYFKLKDRAGDDMVMILISSHPVLHFYVELDKNVYRVSYILSGIW